MNRKGADEVLAFLAGDPEPEDILQLGPSDDLQAIITRLIEKNQECGLSPEEAVEWEEYEHLEHLVRMAKAKALIKMKKQR